MAGIKTHLVLRGSKRGKDADSVEIAVLDAGLGERVKTRCEARIVEDDRDVADVKDKFDPHLALFAFEQRPLGY